MCADWLLVAQAGVAAHADAMMHRRAEKSITTISGIYNTEHLNSPCFDLIGNAKVALLQEEHYCC